MAKVTPTKFIGDPEISQDLADIIEDWYRTDLQDAHKGSDAEDAAYHKGAAEALEKALRLIYGMTLDGEDD